MLGQRIKLLAQLVLEGSWNEELEGADMKNESTAKPDMSKRKPHRARLPGFLIEEEIGLGDVIKRTTYAIGIQPCSGCEKRAEALNQWMHFTR